MINILLVSDIPTLLSLSEENEIKIKKHPCLLNLTKVDMLFVESAWQGYKNRWKYKIASYPEYPTRNNMSLRKLVHRAKDKGIPTVFWNKEDSVHFDRFIDSAKLFDHIFTVDENCIPRYKSQIGKETSVNTLMFGIQPKFHSFTGFNFKYNQANFVGSYSKHIHPSRREWQNQLFMAASETNLGLSIFDRNSKRKSSNYRYPILPNSNIFPALNYPDTAQVYKDYCVSLNVNTVTDSATMFSRRLIEILACGGIAVTTPALSVQQLFSDYCHIVSNPEEMKELFSRLKYGPNKDDLERAKAGSDYVLQNHTWKNRIQQIIETIGLA